MSSKILVVDDDANICEILRLYLANEGFELVFARNGSEALDRFREEKPDLVVLDIMLPIINGWEVCKMIRAVSSAPILMLTARDTTEDKVSGLDIGADDYVVKPFDPKEVVARVRALLRRAVDSPVSGQTGLAGAGSNQAAPGQTGSELPSQEVLRVGNLEVNLSCYTVYCEGTKVNLKPKEIQLLAFLLGNPNIVFTREQLLEKVWGYDYMGETRTVDVHVKRLREKLAAGGPEWRISTVWGVGYKLEID
ncbi:response regulator transcription factor [Phosphitispora fastidiosa]|uniref:response regulator transcription factor n=1 Tax=Phosphitispora fastidiosa TaxID=2837202 RepID=UPI001E588D1C|nr:response regulator transcription factor [Phosphitispora fastidiosa]MBU7006210.1 DNA-binding response OmpR family regulator [Phosphitispora fastidiosa]